MFFPLRFPRPFTPLFMKTRTPVSGLNAMDSNYTEINPFFPEMLPWGGQLWEQRAPWELGAHPGLPPAAGQLWEQGQRAPWDFNPRHMAGLPWGSQLWGEAARAPWKINNQTDGFPPTVVREGEAGCEKTYTILEMVRENAGARHAHLANGMPPVHIGMRRAEHSQDPVLETNGNGVLGAIGSGVPGTLMTRCDGPGVCQLCGEALPADFVALRSHAKRHMDKQALACLSCSAQCKSTSSLTVHVLRHMGIYLFACDLCGKRYPTKWHLDEHRRAHERTAHGRLHGAPDEGLLPGWLEPQAPYDYADYFGHLTRNVPPDIRPPAPMLCPQPSLPIASLPPSLARVVAAEVSPPPPPQPPLRHEDGSSRRSVPVPSVPATPTVPPATQPPPPPPPPPPPQPQPAAPPASTLQTPSVTGGLPGPGSAARAACQICGKALATEFACVREHAKRHHVDRSSLTCSCCGLRCKTSSALTIHVLKHVGVLLFACDVCGKRYTTKWYLQDHRRAHERAGEVGPEPRRATDMSRPLPSA
uniref:zinc finger protein 672-like isoform X1 n=2 Tax=Myxine glutinosa TaxID=7769 RepID=UPI0035902CE5